MYHKSLAKFLIGFLYYISHQLSSLLKEIWVAHCKMKMSI